MNTHIIYLCNIDWADCLLGQSVVTRVSQDFRSHPAIRLIYWEHFSDIVVSTHRDLPHGAVYNISVAKDQTKIEHNGYSPSL